MHLQAPSPEREEKPKEVEENNPEETEKCEDPDSGFPDDAFLMMSQLQWEDDVIWDGSEIKHKVKTIKVFTDRSFRPVIAGFNASILFCMFSIHLLLINYIFYKIHQKCCQQ